MNKPITIAAFVILPIAAFAAENSPVLPEWARPAAQGGLPEELGRLVTSGDNDARAIAYPLVPASAPAIVREGKNGDGICMGCHTTTGMGGPQSAPLAGLPPAYFIRTMADFVNGERGLAYRPNMAAFAAGMSMNEIIETAEYYAALPYEPWIDVVESEMVPRIFVGPRDLPTRYPDGGEEPLGERIVEIAKTAASQYERGAPAFISYVPVGSIALGNDLAERGLGKTIPCAMCHGERLTGRGDVPAIAGRSPLHNARQLLEYRDGLRGGHSALPMLAVVENLSDAEIIAISAYVGSLPAE